MYRYQQIITYFKKVLRFPESRRKKELDIDAKRWERLNLHVWHFTKPPPALLGVISHLTLPFRPLMDVIFNNGPCWIGCPSKLYRKLADLPGSLKKGVSKWNLCTLFLPFEMLLILLFMDRHTQFLKTHYNGFNNISSYKQFIYQHGMRCYIQYYKTLSTKMFAKTKYSCKW